MVKVKVDRLTVATFDGSALIGWTGSGEALAYIKQLMGVWQRRGLMSTRETPLVCPNCGSARIAGAPFGTSPTPILSIDYICEDCVLEFGEEDVLSLPAVLA